MHGSSDGGERERVSERVVVVVKTIICSGIEERGHGVIIGIQVSTMRWLKK